MSNNKKTQEYWQKMIKDLMMGEEIHEMRKLMGAVKVFDNH